MTTVLRAGGLVAAGTSGGPAPGWVAIDGGLLVETGSGPGPRDAVDLGDALLAPGLIDLQVNGLDGVDVGTAEPEAIVELASALAARGVTAFAPTATSRPLGEYPGWLDRLAAARRRAAARDGSGDATAALLGAHLEGPFLGAARGAHPADALRPADLAWTRSLLDAYPDAVAMVTVAPEADPGAALIAMLADRGVTVALGHSRATFSAATDAAAAGATVVTHLFNGMGPLHHREPGLAGAALADARLTPTVIADLVHVHPAVLGVVFSAKATVALVSDVVATTAGPAVGARTALHARAVGGAARLADGTLAGTTVTLERAMANVVGLGVPVDRAIAMATTVPAALLGLTDRGRLAPGTRADLVAVDPRDAAVRAVWLGGMPVRARDGRLGHGSSGVSR